MSSVFIQIQRRILPDLWSSEGIDIGTPGYTQLDLAHSSTWQMNPIDTYIYDTNFNILEFCFVTITVQGTSFYIGGLVNMPTFQPPEITIRPGDQVLATIWYSRTGDGYLGVGMPLSMNNDGHINAGAFNAMTHQFISGQNLITMQHSGTPYSDPANDANNGVFTASDSGYTFTASPVSGTVPFSHWLYKPDLFGPWMLEEMPTVGVMGGNYYLAIYNIPATGSDTGEDPGTAAQLTKVTVRKKFVSLLSGSRAHDSVVTIRESKSLLYLNGQSTWEMPGINPREPVQFPLPQPGTMVFYFSTITVRGKAFNIMRNELNTGADPIPVTDVTLMPGDEVLITFWYTEDVLWEGGWTDIRIDAFDASKQEFIRVPFAEDVVRDPATIVVAPTDIHTINSNGFADSEWPGTLYITPRHFLKLFPLAVFGFWQSLWAHSMPVLVSGNLLTIDMPGPLSVSHPAVSACYAIYNNPHPSVAISITGKANLYLLHSLYTIHVSLRGIHDPVISWHTTKVLRRFTNSSNPGSVGILISQAAGIHGQFPTAYCQVSGKDPFGNNVTITSNTLTLM